MTLNAVIKKASFLILVFCLSAAVVLTGCRKSSPEKVSSSGEGSTASKVSNTNSRTDEPSETLAEIISRRSSWSPILANHYGEEMPDFKVKDIKGEVHSLSDYRGKNVLVVMWATWCQPCVQEIPHLVALREIMPVDKLAVLAISNEPVAVIKAMTRDKNINYTVVSYQGVLPKPFSNIRGYPSTFFIKPDGTLKLATEGASYLGEMKSIILAE
jgi:peroxiredoxin